MKTDKGSIALMGGLVGIAIGGFYLMNKVDDVQFRTSMPAELSIMKVIEHTNFEEPVDKTVETITPETLESKTTHGESTEGPVILGWSEAAVNRLIELYGFEQTEKAFRVAEAEVEIDRQILDIIRIVCPYIRSEDEGFSIGITEEEGLKITSADAYTHPMVSEIRRLLGKLYHMEQYSQTLDGQMQHIEDMQALLELLTPNLNERAREMDQETPYWIVNNDQHEEIDYALWDTYKLMKLFVPGITDFDVGRTDVFRNNNLGFKRTYFPPNQNEGYHNDTFEWLITEMVAEKNGEDYELTVPELYIESQQSLASLDNITEMYIMESDWEEPQELLGNQTPREYFTNRISDFGGNHEDLKLISGVQFEGDEMYATIEYRTTYGNNIQRKILLGNKDDLTIWANPEQ